MPRKRKNSLALLPKIAALKTKGYSLRQIASEVGCSHQQVKILLSAYAVPEYSYQWRDEEFLTRSQMQTRLRKIARSMGWHKLRSALVEKWEKRVLDALCGGEDDLWKIGYLMAMGPTRPGARLERDRQILRSERDWGAPVSVFSEFSYRNSDNSISEDPVDWGAMDPIYGRDAGPAYTVGTKPPRNPPGTTALDCPICGRLTVYSEPICRVYDPAGVHIDNIVIFQFRSENCRTGTCKPATEASKSEKRASLPPRLVKGSRQLPPILPFPTR